MPPLLSPPGATLPPLGAASIGADGRIHGSSDGSFDDATDMMKVIPPVFVPGTEMTMVQTVVTEENYKPEYCHPLLVCPQHLPVAFYEVPKSGSQSFKGWVKDYYDDESNPDLFTCCRFGLGRVLFIVVRNPFTHILSFYRQWVLQLGHYNNVGGNVAKYLDTGKMPSWADFPNFVKVLADSPDTALNPHVKSIIGNLWDTQGNQARRYDVREFFIVHIETVQPDMNRLNQLLCDKYKYCETLPQVSKYNYQESMEYEWPQETIDLVIKRFKCDFEAFGYSMGPANTKPIVKSNYVVKGPEHYESCVNPQARPLVSPETEASRMALRVEKADGVKQARAEQEERERPRGVFLRNKSNWKTVRCGGKTNPEGACSANGVCVSDEKCECIAGFTGAECSQPDYANFPKLTTMAKVQGRPGQNCDDVCQGKGKTCDPNYVQVLNSCGVLHEAFGCVNNKKFQCSKSFGPDQPLFVDPSTTIAKYGECLQNTISSYFGCTGGYKWGIRLCPCF